MMDVRCQVDCVCRDPCACVLLVSGHDTAFCHRDTDRSSTHDVFAHSGLRPGDSICNGDTAMFMLVPRPKGVSAPTDAHGLSFAR